MKMKIMKMKMKVKENLTFKVGAKQEQHSLLLPWTCALNAGGVPSAAHLVHLI